MPYPPVTDTGADGPQSDEAKSREEPLAELAYLRMENAYLKKLEALTQARQTPPDASRPGVKATPSVRRAAEAFRPGAQHVLLSAEGTVVGRPACGFEVDDLIDLHATQGGATAIVGDGCDPRTGEAVNHKTVQRLTVEMGLQALVRPKNTPPTRARPGAWPRT
jgi:hypothetical protein